MPAGGDIINVADIVSAQAASNLKPVVRLTQLVTATTLNDGANTALDFDNEDIDTHGFHSPSVNPSRITPTRAGIYKFYGTMFLPAATDYLTFGVVVAKNGVNQAPFIRLQPGTQGAQRTVSVADVYLTMNGTTDYAQLVGIQDNAANTAKVTPVGATSFTSVFGCEFVRD